MDDVSHWLEKEEKENMNYCIMTTSPQISTSRLKSLKQNPTGQILSGQYHTGKNTFSP